MTFVPGSQLIGVASVVGELTTANTDILASGVSSRNDPSTFRITVALSGADSVLNVIVDDGSDSRTNSLNNKIALSVDTLYTFTYGVRANLTYNFQVASSSVGVHQLLVEEVTGGLI